MTRPVDHLYSGRREAIDAGNCIRCHGTAIKFDTEADYREYLLSALCQACQDEVFDRLGDEDDGFDGYNANG